jgi:hypothetical protein
MLRRELPDDDPEDGDYEMPDALYLPAVVPMVGGRRVVPSSFLVAVALSVWTQQQGRFNHTAALQRSHLCA